MQEPDDFRADNPPSNPELLAYLASELVASGYDFKALCRLILNSKTYQLASLPKSHSAGGRCQFRLPIRFGGWMPKC